MKIRPFQSTTSDYSALLALHHVLNPEEQQTVERLQAQDEGFSAE